MSALMWHAADAETQEFDDTCAQRAYETFQRNIAEQEQRDILALTGQGVLSHEQYDMSGNLTEDVSEQIWLPERRFTGDNEGSRSPNFPEMFNNSFSQVEGSANQYNGVHSHEGSTIEHKEQMSPSLINHISHVSQTICDQQEQFDKPVAVDTMEQTLALVRARLRAIRLHEERDLAAQNQDTYGENVLMEVSEAERKARHMLQNYEQRPVASRPHIPMGGQISEATSLAQQIRSNHKRWEPNNEGGGEREGMASVFPSRSGVNTREHILNKWRRQNQENSQQNQQRSIDSQPQARAHRRQRASLESNFDGLGLGEIMQSSARIERRRFKKSLQNPRRSNETDANTRNRVSRGRPRAQISDFGGSLDEVLSLQSSARSSTLGHNSSNNSTTRFTDSNNQNRRGASRIVDRHAREWAEVGSLNDILSTSSGLRQQQQQQQLQQQQQQQQTTPQTSDSNSSLASNPISMSLSDWGGSLGEILPRVSSNHSVRAYSNESYSSARTRQRSGGRASATNHDMDEDERLVENFISNGLDRSHINTVTRQDYMSDADLTYERMLALDDVLQNRRMTVAAKSKLTTPEALFKSLQNSTYRSKKKIQRKKGRGVGKKTKHTKNGKKNSAELDKDKELDSNENENEDEDDCAICLCEFKHRCSVKKWPCGHIFHPKCCKELLKFDTRCPLCRYDLVTGKHG